MSGSPLAVIYVAGVGHSGSTLLDLMLSSHPAVASVGEATCLAIRPDTRCACGAPGRDACAFWQKVELRVQESTGRRLGALDLLAATPDFAVHNRALFAAVAGVAGAQFVVDSSKSPERLAALLATEGLRVQPVHLLRDPAAVAHSQRRKGRSALRSAWHWRRSHGAVRRLLRARPHVELHYDALVSHPSSALARVLSPLGLSVHPEQLDWADRERHNLGGNRVRWSRSSELQADDEWRRALPWPTRAALRLLAGARPARPGR